jgi:cytochrome c5
MSQVDDAAFVRNFSLVLVFLVVVGIVAFILAKVVNSTFQATLTDDEVAAERLAPVGNANIGEPFVMGGAESTTAAAGAEPAAAAGPVDVGAATYGKICFACHDAGIGGAPKIGDKAAWADRLQKGPEMLVSNAINGFQGDAGIMPPKGGMASLTDDEVRASVMHMLAAVGEGGDAAAPAPAPAAEPAAEAAAATPAAEIPAAEEPAAAAAEPAAAPAVADGRGKEVYDSACFICHATGVAGAPKIGDVAAWEPRIGQGSETLYTHAIKGFMGEAGLMPPKGGRMDYSDEDVKAAVDYMVNSSQ